MVLVVAGSYSTAFTGTSGRLELMSTQLTPPSTVLNTCPDRKPDTVTRAVSGSAGSTEKSLMYRFGNPMILRTNVAPLSVLTCTRPSLVPTYTTLEFEGATAIVEMPEPPLVRSPVSAVHDSPRSVVR